MKMEMKHIPYCSMSTLEMIGLLISNPLLPSFLPFFQFTPHIHTTGLFVFFLSSADHSTNVKLHIHIYTYTHIHIHTPPFFHT